MYRFLKIKLKETYFSDFMTLTMYRYSVANILCSLHFLAETNVITTYISKHFYFNTVL